LRIGLRRPKPAAAAGFVIAENRIGDASCHGHPVFRLHEARETSLDRKIAIAPRANQSPCVKLGLNVANEFP
jgi:hypothetical protein